MNISDYVEAKDGGAIVQFEMSAEETAILVEYAIQKLLKQAVEVMDARSDKPAPLP